MPQGDCENITGGVVATCDSLQQVGGIDRRIYVGQISQIDADIIAFDSDGGVSAFALNSGETLKLFISDEFKQAGRDEGVVAEFGPGMFKHSVDFVHYFFTQEDIKHLEELCKAKRVFCIIETNAGQFKVYGLGNNALGYRKYGLKMETHTHTTGVLGTDDNTAKTTLSGEVPNKPMIYKPLQSGTATLAELNGMSDIASS
jgi:hypothetical protein